MLFSVSTLASTFGEAGTISLFSDACPDCGIFELSEAFPTVGSADFLWSAALLELELEEAWSFSRLAIFFSNCEMTSGSLIRPMAT